MKLNWRQLNDKLHAMTEEEVLALLTEERAGARRITFLERLHQRYTVLRATRERLEILNEGEAV